MTDQPYRERTNDRRVFWWLLLGLVVLFGGLYVAGHLYTSERIPRGTTVAGVELGGLTPAAAETRVRTALRPRLDQAIAVDADGLHEEIEPAKAGLAVDVPASVAQARPGNSWSPARMWDYVVGGDDHPAVLDVDKVALVKAVATLADKVDEPAKEGRVTFADGEADPHQPAPGRRLDRTATAARLQHAFLTADDVVTLPVQRVEPDISRRDVADAMNQFANRAVSAPVVIQLGGEDIVLRPQDYTQALSMHPEGGTLVPAVDDKALLAAMKPKMRRIGSAPENATVALVDGRPKVVPAKKGVTFDPKEITDQFLTLVQQTGRQRTLAVKSVVARPDFTTADARRLRIVERVSSFTTYFPHADYRNVNLGRAAQLVNGTVLKPGDLFSLNRIVGERTAANGFTKGYIISDGVYAEDYGGGVSQVATTTFNAAFFAGLEDVEHKPHSFYIDRYPVGREATVAWPNVDLKFRNDTPYGVLVHAWIVPSTPSSQGEMHVEMWSKKYWDIRAGVSDRYNLTKEETRHLSGDSCVPHDGYGGFDIDVYRYFYRAGSSTLDHKETMHTRYTPSDTVVCS